MKTFLRLALLIMVLLALVACQPVPLPVGTPTAAPPPPTATAAPPAGVDLADTGWVLSSLNGALPLAGTTPTLEFGAGGITFGSDGCNRFRTQYVQDGYSLTLNSQGLRP